jgi:hypothetical protein
MTIGIDLALLALGIAAYRVFFKEDEAEDVWDKKCGVHKGYHHSS